LIIAFTSHGLESDASWPNVTLPNFNLRAANAGAVDKTLSFLYAPYVTDALSWEFYANENVSLLTDALEEDATLPSEKVYSENGGENTLAPIWQHFPPSSSLINLEDSLRNQRKPQHTHGSLP
jgi:hypothetical protein